MVTFKRLLLAGLSCATALACAPSALAVGYRLDSYDATAGAGGSSNPNAITLGPDGNIWFTDGVAGKLGRVTPAGAVTRFPLPGGPNSVTVGPDGALWATRHTDNDVVRLSNSGVVTNDFNVPQPASYPYALTSGPDGNLWRVHPPRARGNRRDRQLRGRRSVGRKLYGESLLHRAHQHLGPRHAHSGASHG